MFGIVEVQLVEVDEVGLEAPQRRVDGVHDVAAAVAHVPAARSGRPEALRRDDELFAAPVEPAADDLLGPADGGQVAAERIHVGGVEERDAALGGPIHDRDGSRFVALEPERHRAETDARNLEAGAAESNVLHRTIMPP